MSETAVATNPTEQNQPDLAALAAFAFNEKPAEAPATNAPETGASAALEGGEPAEEIVDTDVFLRNYFKEKFGFEDETQVLSEWQQLQQLKANPPKAEPQFPDDEAKKWYSYFAQKKEDDLYNSLHARRQIKDVDNMNEEQKLKLYIKLTNPLYDSELVDAVYNKNYTFNEASFKDEDGNITDQLGYRLAKVDAQQKVLQDTQKATDFFAQYKTKIELPDIQAAQQAPDEAYQAYQASTAQANEVHEKVIVPAISALTESNLSLGINVNDANNQMQFEVPIAIEKTDLDFVKKAATDFRGFLGQTFYDERGQFQAEKFASFIAKGLYYDKYVLSAARQAVNAERRRVLGKETPVVPLEKNFATEEPNKLQEIEKLAFGTFGIK